MHKQTNRQGNAAIGITIFQNTHFGKQEQEAMRSHFQQVSISNLYSSETLKAITTIKAVLASLIEWRLHIMSVITISYRVRRRPFASGGHRDRLGVNSIKYSFLGWELPGSFLRSFQNQVGWGSKRIHK